MTLQKLYENIGEDISPVMEHLMSKELIERLIRMLPQDNTITDLKDSLAEGDCKRAFVAAHTLKSIFSNLGFKRAAETDGIIVNELRTGTISPLARNKAKELNKLYAHILDCVTEFIND